MKKGPGQPPTQPQSPPVDNVPFPHDPAQLKTMPPLVIRQEFTQTYHHSYGQDSPFYAGLANGVLLGSRCPACDSRYATPRLACAACGGETDWCELPHLGRIHTFTVCHYSGESFLAETPFILVLVEFTGVETLLMSRLRDCQPESVRIGMAVEARFARPARLDITDLWFVPA